MTAAIYYDFDTRTWRYRGQAREYVITSTGCWRWLKASEVAFACVVAVTTVLMVSAATAHVQEPEASRSWRHEEIMIKVQGGFFRQAPYASKSQAKQLGFGR